MRTREDVLKEMLAACRIQTTMLDDLHFAMADRIAALEARAETRVVTDAMVERAWRYLCDVCVHIQYNHSGRKIGHGYIDTVQYHDVLAALTAALSEATP